MHDTARSAWLAVAVVAVAVLVASVLPPSALAAASGSIPLLGGPADRPDATSPPVPADKLAHAALYAVLTATAVRATTRTPSFRRPVVAAASGAAGYGAAIEVLQSQLVWRTGDPVDAAANAVGAGAVAVTVLAARAVRGRLGEGWP